MGGEFDYQWLADGTAIAGANDSTYVPGASDVGRDLSVRVHVATTGIARTSDPVTIVAASTPPSPDPKPDPAPKPTPVNLVDVSSNKSSKNYTQFHSQIQWLANTGITKGWNVGGGKHEFRAKDEITREAMAAFMYRFAGKPKTTPPATSPFADVPKSSQFYKEVTWLSNAGISTGWKQSKGKPQYRPYDEISREAMAAFLYRLDRL